MNPSPNAAGKDQLLVALPSKKRQFERVATRVLIPLKLVTTCLVAGLATLPVNAAEMLYRVTDIGPMPAATKAGHSARITGINNLGDVIGNTPLSSSFNGFLWSEKSGFTDLGDDYRPFGINDQGYVTGGTAYAAAAAFLWQKDSSSPPTLIGSLAAASGINSKGEIAGASQVYEASLSQAVIWKSATDSINLSQRYGQTGYARDVNTLGDVVGNFGNRSFLWDETTGLTYLAPDATESTAWSINESGQVIGWLSDSRLNRLGSSSFLWEDGELSIFDGPSSGRSEAFGINKFAQIVGVYYNTVYPYSDAYIWDKANGMRDLDSLLVDGEQWQLLEANGINDLGQIVGAGLLNGLRHGFLLTPIPEPSVPEPPSLALIIVSLLVLSTAQFWRRRAHQQSNPKNAGR